MKLCRFGNIGHERSGVIDEDGRIRDLSAIVHEISGDWFDSEGLQNTKDIDIKTLPIISTDTRMGVPLTGIGKIVCAGMNYSDHCEEAGFPVPEQPAMFMKATSSLNGPDDAIVQPAGSTQLDWEIELAAVIGRPAKNVLAKDALSFVAGYTILNDVTDRDFQFNRGGQWFKGKSADTFCPVGPWIVTTDEIGDPQDLQMELTLNGKTMQSGTTKKMVFSVAELIVHTSQYMTLEPGDLLSTGTPPGVGMGHKPDPKWLLKGDVMTLSIQGLGRQTQTVV